MSRPLEILTTRTLLGIRLWDPATDRQVSEGIELTAWPETAPDLITPAFRTASGIFAFQNLPGMYDYEHPLAGTDPLLGSPPITRPFLVKINDLRGNFMPVCFRVELPLSDSGLYQPALISSPIDDEPARFYLFSAPSRQSLPGLAAIRATVSAIENGPAAAYALIEVEENGRRWYGLADGRGCVTILFPYPTFITALGTSPPGLPPSQQHWSLTIRVRYDPGLRSSLDAGELPTLRQIRNQADAQMWATEIAGSASFAQPFELTYGQELILRTGNQSSLWLESGSP